MSTSRFAHAKRRFVPSALQRSVCVLLILVLSFQGVAASPQIAHSMFDSVKIASINSGQNLYLWLHVSGWAANYTRFAREYMPFLYSARQTPPNWDGIESPPGAEVMPRLKGQETQAQRDARVVRLEISPSDIKLRPGERLPLMAIGYDSRDVPVGGFPVEWDAVDEASGSMMNAMEMGRFTAAKAGSYLVKARGNGLTAEARVTVSGPSISSDEPPVGAKAVSSRDLSPAQKSSNSAPQKTELPAREDAFSWNSTNYTSMDDPDKRRGYPLGLSVDGGAGSSNFQITPPGLGLVGRNLDLNLGLVYNSRVWHKAGSEITFNIDNDWPGPGWTLGFDKLVGMGGQSGYALVGSDGTRHPYTCNLTFRSSGQEAVCKTTDGTFIDYKVLGDTPESGGAPHTANVFYPNGTEVVYVSATTNGNINYPSQIIDASGNRILISYRNNKGPEISNIIDPLGRVIQFFYDSNNLLVAVTAPGYGLISRQTVMRITWSSINLADLGANYGFAGLTTRVRNNVVPIIKAIYYPANGAGLWFGDSNSYSDYGMISKVVEQVGMSFSGAPLPSDPNQPADQGVVTAGSISRQIVYDYPAVASSLGREPSYQNATETWADMDVDPAVTHYDVQEDASPRRILITRPDGVTTELLSHNAPGQTIDGMIYTDTTRNPQGAVIGKSFVNWVEGDYRSPRPSFVEITDERNLTTGKEFGYGPRFNQVTEVREYGYGYMSGGAKTLLRRTASQYLNDPDYTDPQPENNGVWHHIFNLVTVKEVYSSDNVRLSRIEYVYDQFKGTAGLMDTPGINNGGYENSMSPYVNPNYNIYGIDARGNMTTVRRFPNAATLDSSTAVVETRHYDITGNVRRIERSCCEVTTINYTVDTQYAWPQSQIRGSASDSNVQNTTAVTYDFNTSKALTITDPNGRVSQNIYLDGQPRPLFTYSPTGSYTFYAYDDARRINYEFVYEAGKSGADISARTDKYLDGHGNVHREIGYGKNLVRDVVENKYDQMGRVFRQTRPYRDGVETPQWATIVYDYLDREVATISPDGSTSTKVYNQGANPAGSSGQIGQTVTATNPWGKQRWARSDALGRMVEVGEPNPNGNGTLASGAMFTSYNYDALDRLIQITQGDQIRTMRYDSLNRLTHQKLAEQDATLNDDGQYIGAGRWTQVFSYDTSSNLTQSVDARGVRKYYYYLNDPLNRPMAVQYDKTGVPAAIAANIPEAPNVNYAYMTTGDKTRVWKAFVDSGMGNKTFSYDSEGRLSAISQTFRGRESSPLVTTYLWDSLDRSKEKTYPTQYGAGETRKTVQQTYGVASRIDSLRYDNAIYFSDPVYNADSQLSESNVGVVKEKYNYDAVTGLLTSQSIDRGADNLLNLKYNYTLDNDPNNNGMKTGQLTGVTDLRNQARNRAYVYDTIGRLKMVKGGINAFLDPSWSQTYSYDRYCNRLGVSKVGSTPEIPRDGLAALSYNSTNNRIITPGFAYDATGNQIGAVINESGTQHQYRYDEAGRLAQVLNGEGTVVLASYSYGATNERLIGTEQGVTKIYSWDSGQIIAEYEAVGTNNLQWRTGYVFLGERLLATTSGTNGMETRFHHPDRLGTRLVTDSTGDVVTEQLTLPYGTLQPFSGTPGGDSSYQNPAKNNPSRKRFTTYDRSEVTNLDYAINRDYDSAQGRYKQVDPLQLASANLDDPQSLNMYAYCGGDPMNHTDLEGLFFGALWRAIKAVFKFVAMAVAVAVAVVTIVLAPVAFVSVVQGIFGIISTVAAAASSVLNYFGYTKAAGILGIIGAAASLGSSIANVAAEFAKDATKVFRNIKGVIIKAVASAASFVSKTLNYLGHKTVGQVFGLADTVLSYVGGAFKAENKGDKYKFTTNFREVFNVARSTAEQVATLAGATSLATVFNAIGIPPGIVDDVNGFIKGVKKWNEMPKKDAVTWEGTTLIDREIGHWQMYNNAKLIQGFVKNVTGAMGKIEKGVALAR